MLTRTENIEYSKGRLQAWRVIKYKLFGFIVIYINKVQVK